MSSAPTPGTTHGFLAKLNSAGSALTFSTFIGGTANDSVNGVTLDPLGNVYLTGNAGSLDFPTTPNAFQTGAYIGNIFVAKFSSAGTVVYSTLIGGSGSESAAAIAVDSKGSAYVTGLARGGFPVTANAFETAA